MVLSVSADDSPAYFLAPNDLVSQVKQSAALRPVPDVSVRVSLEVSASCWSATQASTITKHSSQDPCLRRTSCWVPLGAVH